MAGLFEAAVRFMRRQPGTVLGLGAVAGFTGAAANLVVLATVYPGLQDQLNGIEPLVADGSDQTVAAQALIELLISTTAMLLLVAAITVPVYAVVNGALILVLGRDVFGERTSSGQAWSGVARKIGPLLLQLVVIAAVAAASTLPLVLALSMAGSDPVIGLGLAVLLAPLCLVAFLIVVPRLILAPVCLVLEDLGVAESFVRARQLVRGASWRVLGVGIAAFLITRLLAAFIAVPFSVLGGGEALSTQGVFLTSLGRIAGTSVGFPILCAVIALLYVDLRVRTEGLRAPG